MWGIMILIVTDTKFYKSLIPLRHIYFKLLFSIKDQIFQSLSFQTLTKI